MSEFGWIVVNMVVWYVGNMLGEIVFFVFNVKEMELNKFWYDIFVKLFCDL